MKKEIKEKFQEVCSLFIDCETMLQELAQKQNLKVHQVAYYLYDLDLPLKTVDNLFGEFCDSEFSVFNEYLKELGIDFNDFKRIGGTSSFRFLYKNFDLHQDKHNDYILHHWNFGGEFLKSFDLDYLRSKNKNFSWLLKELKQFDSDDFDWLFQEAVDELTELKTEFENYLKAKKYLDEFKKNQVENFKEFLKDNLEVYLIDVDSKVETYKANLISKNQKIEKVLKELKNE